MMTGSVQTLRLHIFKIVSTLFNALGKHHRIDRD